MVDSSPSIDAYPTAESLRRFYEQGWERMWLPDLRDRLVPDDAEYRRRMEATFALLDLRDDSEHTVLDAGCGIGIYTINLAKRWPKLRLFAFDISRTQIEAAKRLAALHGVADRCHFFVADAGATFLCDTFDFIVCAELLEHLPEPRGALLNLRAMGGKDTVYVFSVPQSYLGRQQTGLFCKQVLADGTEVHTQDRARLVQGVPVYEYYHELYTLASLKELLSSGGFCVEQSLGTHFLLPLRTSGADCPTRVRLWARAWNGLGKAVRTVGTRLSPRLDRLLNRALGNRWAATLIVRCRLE